MEGQAGVVPVVGVSDRHRWCGRGRVGRTRRNREVGTPRVPTIDTDRAVVGGAYPCGVTPGVIPGGTHGPGGLIHGEPGHEVRGGRSVVIHENRGRPRHSSVVRVHDVEHRVVQIRGRAVQVRQIHTPAVRTAALIPRQVRFGVDPPVGGSWDVVETRHIGRRHFCGRREPQGSEPIWVDADDYPTGRTVGTEGDHHLALWPDGHVSERAGVGPGDRFGSAERADGTESGDRGSDRCVDAASVVGDPHAPVAGRHHRLVRQACECQLMGERGTPVGRQGEVGVRVGRSAEIGDEEVPVLIEGDRSVAPGRGQLVCGADACPHPRVGPCRSAIARPGPDQVPCLIPGQDEHPAGVRRVDRDRSFELVARLLAQVDDGADRDRRTRGCGSCRGRRDGHHYGPGHQSRYAQCQPALQRSHVCPSGIRTSAHTRSVYLNLLVFFAELPSPAIRTAGIGSGRAQRTQ